MNLLEQRPIEIVSDDQLVIPELDISRRSTSIVWSESISISGTMKALKERIKHGQEAQSRRTRAAAEAIRNTRLMVPLFEMSVDRLPD